MMDPLGVVALLLMLNGDVVTASPIGTYATAPECHAYAQARLPEAVRLGASGIGCAERVNNSIAIKIFGPVPKALKGGKR